MSNINAPQGKLNIIKKNIEHKFVIRVGSKTPIAFIIKVGKKTFVVH